MNSKKVKTLPKKFIIKFFCQQIARERGVFSVSSSALKRDLPFHLLVALRVTLESVLIAFQGTIENQNARVRYGRPHAFVQNVVGHDHACVNTGLGL